LSRASLPTRLDPLRWATFSFHTMATKHAIRAGAGDNTAVYMLR
jgi:hypothetical protein